MAKYVLDTNFFILMREYYPEVFPSLWGRMDDLAGNEIITSIDEVEKELRNFGGEQGHLLFWMQEYQHLFERPSVAIQEKMPEVMSAIRKDILEKKMAEEKPWADPIIIAKGFALSATVVTREKRKGGYLRQIPDICDHFGIRCITAREFMVEQGWRF